MMNLKHLQSERGVALVLVLFLSLVVAVLSAGAAMIGTNASVINKYSEKASLLTAVADEGIEQTRSRINGDASLYPADGYSVLEDGVPVYDHDGSLIEGVRRWTYVGPSGVTSGQYGMFGSIVVVVEDQAGNRMVRRGEIAQESFAKFAYFTDIEPSNISFGGGDQLQGPVHTNDYLKIYSSGASFLGKVTTGKKVLGSQYGTFAQGYTEYAPRIDMPVTADLSKLKAQALAGGMAFVGNTSGGAGRATTRVEFVAIDLNNDGLVNGGNEGFIKVYQSNDARYVVADIPSDYGNRGLRNSRNCGNWKNGVFRVADDLPSNGSDRWINALTSSTRRCYLGGSDSLFGAFQATGGSGQWLQWNGPIDPLVAGRPDAQYLFPINRQMNPTFKGVIHVTGHVAISGVLRGQVTLAATGDVLIADDVVYATNPGAGTCADMLGVFAGDDVMISDNTINAPVRPKSGYGYRTYDDTKGEFIHGVLLALDIFTVDNYAGGSSSAEPCETRSWGRGCIYLTGGIIQRTRGAVGLSSGRGYLKRYSYDQCAFSNAPPYFPTTGRFVRGRYYEVDPTNFNVDEYWAMMTPRN